MKKKIKENRQIEKKQTEKPKRKVGWFVYWVPRIFSILLIAFMFLMSFDVFESGGFWDIVLAFFMHNIPVIILIVVLIISWKHELVGGIAFILAGLLYIVFVMARMIEAFQWYYLAWILQISGIAFLIGILFLIGWHKKRKK